MLVMRFPLIVLLAGALYAQDLVVDGVVRRPSGEPVADVEVVVVKQADRMFDPAEVLTEASTDAAGAFSVTLTAEWLARPEYKRVQAMLLGPEGGLAAVQVDLESLPIGGTWNLELAPTEPWTLTLLQANGAPAVGIEVAPDAIGNDENFQVCRVPLAVRPRLVTTTDADGRATVTRWTRAQLGVGLFVHPDGMRERRWPNKHFRANWLPERGRSASASTIHYGHLINGSETFTLHARAEIELRAAVDLPDAAVGRPITARGLGPVGEDDQEFGWDIKLEARVPSAGQSVVVSAPAGYPSFSMTSEHLTLQFTRVGEQPPFDEWSVSNAEAVPARGRVVDEETGEGVAGVQVELHCYPVSHTVTTDTNGDYRFDAKRPAVGLELVIPPAPYLPVDPFVVQRGVEITEEMTEVSVPTVRLAKRGRRAVGVVVGPDGVAIEGALVRCEVTGPGARLAQLVFGVTDAQGTFSFGIPTSGAANLTASHGGARTSASTPVGGEPVAMTLTRLTGLAGRVSRDGGAPGEGLQVEVWSASPENMLGGEKRLTLDGQESVDVATNGAFTVPAALDLDQRYCLVVHGPDVESVRSSFRTAREWSEGEVSLDVRPLVTLRGTVAGADGEPLAGMRVFARGGTTGAVETRTDEHGHFTLDGFLPGGGVVLVEGPDGLVAQRVAPEEAATIRVGGESPALEIQDASDRAKELTLARELLIEGIEAEEESYFTLRLFEQLARVDPAEALARLEASGLDDFRSNMVRRAMMEGLRTSSFDEAVALTESMTSSGFAARAFVELAHACEEPGRRLALLGQALANARAVQAPEHRLVDLSHVAEALFDYGHVDLAREILVGSIPLADSLSEEEWSGFARAAFAEELVHFDYENAMRFVQELRGGDRERHIGNMAHELAASDPARAEELLGIIPPRASFRVHRYAPRVCHDMAPVDLERALKIAERHDPHGFSHGMIASALVGTDPAKAREVLDEAYRRLIEASESPREVPYFTGIGAAGAALLTVSEQLGLEHLPGDVACVLALRQSRPALRRFHEQEQAYQVDGRIAFYVARYDPELARALLEPSAAWLAGHDGQLDSDWSAFFAGAAVVDPEWAAGLAAQHGGLAVRVVAAVLGREGEERRRYVQDEYFHLWIPGKEDL